MSFCFRQLAIPTLVPGYPVEPFHCSLRRQRRSGSLSSQSDSPKRTVFAFFLYKLPTCSFRLQTARLEHNALKQEPFGSASVDPLKLLRTKRFWGEQFRAAFFEISDHLSISGRRISGLALSFPRAPPVTIFQLLGVQDTEATNFGTVEYRDCALREGLRTPFVGVPRLHCSGLQVEVMETISTGNFPVDYRKQFRVFNAAARCTLNQYFPPSPLQLQPVSMPRQTRSF
eukprot:2819382-Rhodomonas_salina.2